MSIKYPSSRDYLEANQIKKLYQKAMEKLENYCDDGSINWNYINADMYMDAKEEGWEPSLWINMAVERCFLDDGRFEKNVFKDKILHNFKW